MARTASSSRCWGSALRRESSAGAQVKRRCSWASVSWLPQLELQLGSHFTPQRRCGQGCLTTCCPNTAEGAVELVQLCLVGVQHLGSWLGFEPHLTFSCPNLNKGKLEEKRVRLTTFIIRIIILKNQIGIPDKMSIDDSQAYILETMFCASTVGCAIDFTFQFNWLRSGYTII